MSNLALVLVLISAFLHASWNLMAKRASGGAPFVWLSTLLATVIWAPVALVALLWQRPYFGWLALFFLAGTGFVHVAYSLFLQKSYRIGDFSLVYPLARGTGPLLSTTAAILLLGERPSWLALSGMFLIAVGVFVLIGHPSKLFRPNAGKTVLYGTLTGFFIAVYTLWDKYAVATLLIPPILLAYMGNVGQMLLLTPAAWHNWPQVRQEWQNHQWEAIGIAALSPLAFILVLIALVSAPVSYVAPLREVSILIGTIMGARLLSEEDATRRLIAAAMMVLGVVALATH